MRYHILATDYDGTIAHNGAVPDDVVEALERFIGSGRKLVMVTGRELPDLMRVFPHLELFELVVAENGAVLHTPKTRENTALADRPPPEFVDDLRKRGVGPISVGESIVATWEPHSTTVLETIRDHGLELQVIFNKGAVMILPAGVNKATGLKAALERLGISPHNVVGVGDAENDHSFLRLCEAAAAVANALPSVKEEADFVAVGDHGAGVVELIDALLADDLAGRRKVEPRRALTFGVDADGNAVDLEPYGGCTLICGASASGKSTVAKRIVDSLRERDYQFCLVDPEGDYEELEGAIVIGAPDVEPTLDEAMQVLEDFLANCVVCMTGVSISERPQQFVVFLTELLQMRVRYGRPHWLIFDEAHHLMPAAWQPPNALLPERLVNAVLVTVHPELLSPDMLRRVDQVVAVGNTAPEVIERFGELRGIDMRRAAAPKENGEVLLWRAGTEGLRSVRVHPPAQEHRRHTRKYAEGNLPPERSFYFRGRNAQLNLRAHNLLQFLELAEGVDEATWAFHFGRGDYSRWFREGIKDPTLAAEAEVVEQAPPRSRGETLRELRSAIERRYTLPVDTPIPVPGAD
jgi:hydroxymethylpyrimidine pyrophosphatase-like HAD family hydrolase